MTAEEQSWSKPADFLPRSPVVVAGVPSNVRHENADAFAFPIQVSRQIGADVGAIYVAINSPHRFKLSQPVQNIGGTKIPRMPYLIALREVLKHRFVQKAVSVRKQSDSQPLLSSLLSTLLSSLLSWFGSGEPPPLYD